MRTIRADGPGVDVVIAAQRGDRRALDSLLAQYLPLLYNIIGRALNGHADTDDVVQETMLRAVRGLPELRDPSAFRSWLVAVAVRQVRDHVSARRVPVAADPAGEVADPDADFENLTILRLGLSGQRRETAEATRWLDHEDREVLALWWQEAAGALDRDAVASGLGMSAAHTAVRISRMKERLTTARLVVRALRARPPCSALATVMTGWDAKPSPLWRKRLARHARDCPRCRTQLTGMVPAEQLLAGLPLVPAPLIAARLLAQAAPAAPAAPAGQPPGPPRGRRAPGRRGLRHASSARHLRALPKAAAYAQPKLVIAAVAATTCVAAGAVAAVKVYAAPAAHVTAAARPKPPAPAPSTRPTVAAKTPAPTRRPHRHHHPRPKPRPTPTPPLVRVTATAKGVSAWNFPGVTKALAQSGASWYYTWSAAPAVTAPAGVSFVPMIWGAADVTSATLAQVRGEGHILLGFNEPDMSSQANMTVASALSLWPKLMATGMTLGSPAVADDAATPGGWLDRFMTGARARGYRVNFITVHWYGADFATAAAVSQLRGYLQAIYARYHLPIWLTEFGLENFGGSPAFPTATQQAAFLTAATTMLGRLGYIQRYAWFALPVSSGDGTLGLFSSGPVVTPVGRAFEAAGG
jgi:RNA polymerase sigma factor (sigma-70 family)